MHEPKAEAGPTHIAIYHLQEGSRHQFQIRLGHDGHFNKTHPAWMKRPERVLDLIHVETIPQDIIPAVRAWLDARQPFEDKEDPRDPHHCFLGTLGWDITDARAKTAFKFPKSIQEDAHRIILKMAAPRWGSHLEAECAKHLERLGVKTTRCGDHPTPDVLHVVREAGLDPYGDNPIREYYEKLEAYYQARRKPHA